MSSRKPVAALLTGLAASCGLVLGLVGCLQLGLYGLVMVGLAAATVAAAAAGVLGEDRSAAMRVAGTAAVWTLAVLLLIAGIATLAGGVVAVVCTCLAGAGAATWLLSPAGRSQRERVIAGLRGVGGGRSTTTPSPDPTVLAILHETRLPVSCVSTSELGREWLRTTSALTARMEPAQHRSLVRRRRDVLDELERRNPDGFSRWLVSGSFSGGDPAWFMGQGGGRNAGVA